MRLHVILIAIAIPVYAAAATVLVRDPTPVSGAAPPRYVGPAKCKNCHQGKKCGDPYGIWKKGPHAGAFAKLDTDRARVVAAEAGVKEPHKNPDCLRCHVTAFGAPEKARKKLKHSEGVSCEACHGPGDKHFKTRFMAAAKGENPPVEPGEIVSKPALKTCLGCHNEKSPTFRPFCFKMRWEKIKHLDPRKKRSAEELAAMKCDCGETCTCTKGECGCPHDPVR